MRKKNIFLIIAFLTMLGCDEKKELSPPIIYWENIGQFKDIVEIDHLLLSFKNEGKTTTKWLDMKIYLQKDGIEHTATAPFNTIFNLRPYETAMEIISLPNPNLGPYDFIDVKLEHNEIEYGISAPPVDAIVIKKEIRNYSLVLWIKVHNNGKVTADRIKICVYVQKNGRIIDATWFNVHYLDAGDPYTYKLNTLFGVDFLPDDDEIKINARVITF